MINTKQEEGKIKFYWDNGKYLGYSYMEVDGYYVFLFDKGNGGFWSDYVLRAIASKLLKLNKEWNDKINKEFNNE